MTRSDIDTLRAMYAAVDRGDWEAAFRHAHPELEWRTPDFVPHAGTYSGPDAVRRFFEEQWAAFDEVVIEPERFFAGKGRIVAYVYAKLRPERSTAVVENRIAHLWTMREGKAATCVVFARREDALEAACLSEEDAAS